MAKHDHDAQDNTEQRHATDPEMRDPNADQHTEGHSIDDYLVIKAIVMAGIGANGKEVQQKMRPVLCARIWGRVDGMITADNAEGQTFEGLGGSFYCEAVQSGNRFRSPRAFLPPSLQNLLLDGNIPDEGREFMAQVVAVPASNPSGYSWVGSLILTNETVDDPAFTVPARAAQRLLGAGPLARLLENRS